MTAVCFNEDASQVMSAGIDNTVKVWDLRNMLTPQQKRESSLKFQTRCLRVFPDKSGFTWFINFVEK